MLKTAICELLGIEYPVIQGGMAYLGSPELVVAVSEAGGLGVLGTGNAAPDWVREQIRLVRMLTDRPFGANVLLMSPFAEEVMKVVIEEEVPLVTTGGGDPSMYIAELKAAGATVAPVVSSVATSKRLANLGVDALIAEGMESAGHVGDVTTMALVPQVVDSVTIPVIAAGGITDGRGLVAALALGAEAVQMGTRFVCAEECIAHPGFKQRILEADGHVPVIIGQSTGHPIRCLENELTRQISAKEGSSQPVDEYFRAGKVYSGVIEGKVEDGFLMAGQGVGLIGEIKSAKQIIQDLIAEAEEVIAGFSRCLNGGYL
ncbi:nitronate monooxygenase [Chloroflexota bacterium]